MSAPPIAPPRPARARPAGPGAAPQDDTPRHGSAHPDALLLPVAALVVTACLPLTRVFIGFAFLRPVLAAALLSLGVSWVSRRLGAGPLTTVVASALAWVVFGALAFLPDTLRYGLVPTFETAGAARDLWLHGIELIRTRPAPAFAEAGLLLITASGVWWVAHAMDGLVFRLRAPLRAIAMALVLWGVPLAMVRDDATAWVWAAPVLAAAAWLLGAADGTDLTRWGARVKGQSATAVWDRSGAIIAGAAIVAGALLGGLLPGFGDPPYYRVQRLGGDTTITTNPIVSIRANLVSQSPTPVALVRTPQPVYLRLTALDTFGEREEWTRQGIRSGPASGRLPFETEVSAYRELEVEVTAEGLDGAILVPVPYQPMRLSGPAAGAFGYDRNSGTVTVGAGHGLAVGDTYEVVAAIPDPGGDTLVDAPVEAVDPALTTLPRNVPDEVVALAHQIVDEAGADNAFDKALAIQNELRGWTYSLEPPAGHGRSAMQSFVENRIGYCEQYAGTMAVMLRVLGIPARVAVGYTPGEVVADDGEAQTYLVTRANAHAWVEVLFPGSGWIAFEPTPRDDGNVLTPSATNLAPASTDAEQELSESAGELGQFEDPMDLVPELPADTPLGSAEAGADGTGGAGRDGRGLWVWIAALVAVAALAATAVRARARVRSRHDQLPAAARVLRANDRVRRLGRGLGLAPRPAETDREYLVRLVTSAPNAPRSLGPAQDLAGAAARARYAPAVSVGQARAAEAAAARLRKDLLDDQSAGRRLVVPARGAAGEALAALLARARRPQSDGAAQETPARVHGLVTRR